MPPPPPPPPVGGPRIPKPALTSSKGGSTDRGALLSSIAKGAKLKKVVTNDRSTPLIDGKITSSSSSNSSASSGGMGSIMANGGAPQLGGLFAGGMPKLRPTGRAIVSDNANGTIKPSPPALPASRKPSAPATPQPPVKSNSVQQNHSSSNGYLPPSPKPSSKSSPAPPPPPPSNRKPSLGGRAPFLDIPIPSSKPALPQPPSTDAFAVNGDKHPPLPTKPSFRIKTDRGAPPRPPNSSKPILPPKSPDLKPSSEGGRRVSIDRSKSMREPVTQNYFPQTRVGTSAESPAAPFRTNNNHREAPPIPSVRPASKTVGRAAGNRMAPVLRPPTDRPPRPPVRPMVAAPPPPSQPPPPPPAHKNSSSSHQNAPPPPPERNESTRTSCNRLSGEFEARFVSMFKSRHQFPNPLILSKTPKIYPSKSNGKNQRRAPQPPGGGLHQGDSSHPNNNIPLKAGPPPPPPHAPLHLQMERKFYGAEASHC